MIIFGYNDGYNDMLEVGYYKAKPDVPFLEKYLFDTFLLYDPW